MFNSSRSFILTLVSLSAILLGVAHAAPFDPATPGHHGVSHTHINDRTHKGPQSDVVGAAHNLTFDVAKSAHAFTKRYDNARLTYYDAGQNACGSYDKGDAYVIALASPLFNGGEHCYKPVTIQYNGKKVQATVTDECPGCKDAQADLSRPLFAALAPLDKGVIYASWWFD